MNELNVRKPSSEIRNMVEIPSYVCKIANYTGATKRIKDTRSNHILVFENLKDSKFVIWCNQKLRKIVVLNCQNSLIQTIDSAVISSQQCEVVGCHDCEIAFEYVECKDIRFYDCHNCRLNLGDDPLLIDTFKFSWWKSSNNFVDRTRTLPGINPDNPEVTVIPWKTIKSFPVPPNKDNEVITCYLKDGKNLEVWEIETIGIRTSHHVLKELEHALANNRIFEEIPRDEKEQMFREEIREYEDPPEVVAAAASRIAKSIKAAKHVVVYTGAGVSTSAKIGDYRGPQGAWTVRDYGVAETETKKELDQALPTFTHYAITELARRGIVKFLISTNLDGLHIRSGMPLDLLSEMHGNCYKEYCLNCGKIYLRSFDVLKTRTDRWTHLTGRQCTCGGQLRDTIAHFTENIDQHEYDISAVNSWKADVALILGTSVFVQPAASLPYKVLENEGGEMFIVNLQCTPADSVATLKVYAETDHFMKLLMEELGIEKFDMSYDHTLTLIQLEKAEERRKKVIFCVQIGAIVGGVILLTWIILSNL